MVVNKEYVLAAYCEARNTLDHDQAVAQVAGETGQAIETVEAVIREEAVA
jgi:hypothetical protein